MKRSILFICGMMFAVLCANGEKGAWLYPDTPAFRAQTADLAARGITLTDMHIHIRGGMTPQKMFLRQEASGIRGGCLANHGHGWELDGNKALNAFIDEMHAASRKIGKAFPVGIQVNDRDWFRQIDPHTLRRLDYVLADTMIMGVRADGKPQLLWEDFDIPDAGAWMEKYMAHNLQILDEPVSILANPTYLPKCIAARYDELWTDARLKCLFTKAAQKGVAIEIQAESGFQTSPRFLRMAKACGVKFSFGSNNFTDKTKNLDDWFHAIQFLNLHAEDLYVPTLRGERGNVRELFNGRDLTNWYTFLRGRGKGQDPEGVFTVSDGILHISGKEFGCLTTEEEFDNYRLIAEFRFTGKTYGSKAKAAPDSGLLFHSTGPDGGFGGIWMLSHEYNLVQGASGDFWTVGRKDRPDISLTAEVSDEKLGGRYAIWKEGGTPVTLTGNGRVCRFDIARDWTDTLGVARAVNENPDGVWNTAELVCRKETATCFFNGKCVNKAIRVCPSRGRIQLQSEGCGIEFRRVTLLPLSPDR